MITNKNIQGLIFTAFFIKNVYAEEVNSDDYGLIYGSEKMQSIAAGHPLPQNLSPSVTSTITNVDIERIGARRLQDILEYLPGVHISNARNGNSVIGFRGIYSETNSQVLILVNGIPQKNTLVGGKPLVWTMPVKNISHIEVIRGPGSMLYGGDATTGVINVILKTGKELKGGDVGSFFGSQDTYDGWAEYGDKKGDLEYAFSMQGGTTKGSQGRIDSDAQTLLDSQFGTRVSNAPGFTNNGRDDIDARVDVAYQDWVRFRAGYQRFNHVQTGEGGTLALDNMGATNVDIYNSDLSIKNKIFNNLEFESKIYFLGQETSWDVMPLPKGTLGGLLPQGARSVSNNFQGTSGLTSQFNYTGLKKHNVTFGTGIIYNWVSDISNKINYLITPDIIQQVELTEASVFGPDVLKKSRNRTNFYALFQDEWQFASDWYLTTGLRYDYYSDTSAGLSPRASLVWDINQDLTAKILYSRAFRPPSFYEKNSPLIVGGRIKSEIMDTLEFQIENKWSSDLVTSANVYWFELDNLITSVSDSSLKSASIVSFVPTAFSNTEKINGIGVETEGRYQLNDNLNLSIN